MTACGWNAHTSLRAAECAAPASSNAAASTRCERVPARTTGTQLRECPRGGEHAFRHLDDARTGRGALWHASSTARTDIHAHTVRSSRHCCRPAPRALSRGRQRAAAAAGARPSRLQTPRASAARREPDAVPACGHAQPGAQMRGQGNVRRATARQSQPHEALPTRCGQRAPRCGKRAQVVPRGVQRRIVADGHRRAVLHGAHQRRAVQPGRVQCDVQPKNNGCQRAAAVAAAAIAEAEQPRSNRHRTHLKTRHVNRRVYRMNTGPNTACMLSGESAAAPATSAICIRRPS